MSDLLLEAPPALLDGWCGPVVYRAGGRTPGVVVGTCEHKGTRVFRVWWESPAHPHGTGHPTHPSALLLDLSRAECRDRVARVVAAVMRLDTANGVQYLLRSGEPQDAPGFIEACGGRIFVTASLDEGTMASPLDPWLMASSEPDEPWLTVPALATLDPNDNTRLPDGSRRVDALALLHVARTVLQ